MLREWKTEWMKLRRRKVELLLLAFLGFTFLWCAWILSDADAEALEDGYRWIFSNLSIINTILLPTMLAMLASRICDMEIKGNTLKLICTMENKGRLFDMKFLTGSLYLILYISEQSCCFCMYAAEDTASENPCSFGMCCILCSRM